MSDIGQRDPTRRHGRLSYANVAATLALFFALTGTATAAIVLPHDSVGAEQIQSGAVRSAEILDESVVLADLTQGARAALDAPRVRVDGVDSELRSVSQCFNLPDCSNLLAIHLPEGRWLVQAKLAVLGNFAPTGNPCGLVQNDTTVIDEAPNIGDGQVYISDENNDVQTSEQVALAAVVTTAPGGESTTVALRCAEYQEDEHLYWRSGKLTAIEVKDEAQTD
jgi:hypothetical protein